MKIDGVSINHNWAASKTQDEFVKEFSGPGYAHLWPELTGSKRLEKFKEAHRLCKEKVASNQANPDSQQ
jgi:hypothetical protein